MVDIHLPFIIKIINVSFENGFFPNELKLAEISSIFKKNNDLDKENANFTSHVSKVFERIMYMQIDTFMRDKFSKLLAGFRRNYGTQPCLMSMLEMWKNTLHKGGYVSAIFMDLSKAFDTFNHNLLTANLGAYGFERDSLSFVKSYLNDTQQRIGVNNNFSSWEKIIAGVPQGLILGPLLFNIFINDFFLFVASFTLSNYVDDNTLHAPGLT